MDKIPFGLSPGMLELFSQSQQALAPSRNALARLQAPEVQSLLASYNKLRPIVESKAFILAQKHLDKDAVPAQQAFYVLSKLSAEQRDQIADIVLQEVPAQEGQATETVQEFSEEEEKMLDSWFPEFNKWSRSDKLTAFEVVINLIGLANMLLKG